MLIHSPRNPSHDIVNGLVNLSTAKCRTVFAHIRNLPVFVSDLQHHKLCFTSQILMISRPSAAPKISITPISRNPLKMQTLYQKTPQHDNKSISDIFRCHLSQTEVVAVRGHGSTRMEDTLGCDHRSLSSIGTYPSGIAVERWSNRDWCSAGWYQGGARRTQGRNPYPADHIFGEN